MTKEARRIYDARYRRTHRQHLSNYRRKRRELCPQKEYSWYYKTREIINNAKDKPCADCGIKYPSYVMDFDHVRGKKEIKVGSGSGVSLVRLLAEISKCDVVCSNCHRERTHARKALRKH